MEQANSEIRRLNAADSSIKKRREQAMEEMQHQVSRSQKKLSDLKSAANVAKHNRDKVVAELKSFESEKIASIDQSAVCQKNIENFTEEAKQLENQVWVGNYCGLNMKKLTYFI